MSTFSACTSGGLHDAGRSSDRQQQPQRGQADAMIAGAKWHNLGTTELKKIPWFFWNSMLGERTSSKRPSWACTDSDAGILASAVYDRLKPQE